MLNFAHRGFRRKYPENTQLAFTKALEAGAQGIELDVHLSRDGEVVILHDEFVDRTSDGTGLVSSLTLAELKKLNFAHLYPDLDAQRIVTLAEYLEWVREQPLITNIELKNGILPYPGLEERVCDLVRSFGLQERVLISSFNHPSLVKMKQLDPELKCGALVENILQNPWTYLDMLGVECFHPYAYQLTRETVGELHRRGYEVNCWYYAYHFGYADTLATGVDGMITDDPDQIHSLCSAEK